jgi:uncharacterized membrane protein
MADEAGPHSDPRIQWTIVSAPVAELLGAIAPRALRHRHPDAAAQLPSACTSLREWMPTQIRDSPNSSAHDV